MNLLMLAPEIQEEVLFGAVDMPLKELMPVLRSPLWSPQRRMLHLARPA